MKHQDLRKPTEKFDDMLADDYSLDEIGRRMGWTPVQTRSRYLTVCAQLGVKPDADT